MTLFLNPDEVQVFHESRGEILVPSGYLLSYIGALFGVPICSCPGLPNDRALIEYRDSEGKLQGKVVRILRSRR